MNGVRVNTVDVGGPVRAGHRPVRGEREEDLHLRPPERRPPSACARRIVTSLARRAFRRPVAAGEVDKIVALVQQAQKKEASFDEGLVVGIQALLVSPDFLFRIERDRRAVRPRPIPSRSRSTSWRHACRTSSGRACRTSALRRAADSGTLRNPAVLAAQVRRMLRDPKSRALAENFGGQWLQFRALESVTRDRERFPDFDDYLRLSMRRETELFVEHIVRQDRSILDFIDGRYTFLNERLARHYGIAGVSGPEFRKVDLTGTPRGGVLTQGSVLTVSSYATRTSPVLRGKWILDNLLDAPPPIRRRTCRTSTRAKIGTDGVGAPAAGGAPQESDLRVVSPADGPARLRPRELRRRRRLADHGRQVSDRRVRGAARRRRIQRARTSCGRS